MYSDAGQIRVQGCIVEVRRSRGVLLGQMIVYNFISFNFYFLNAKTFWTESHQRVEYFYYLAQLGFWVTQQYTGFISP